MAAQQNSRITIASLLNPAPGSESLREASEVKQERPWSPVSVLRLPSPVLGVDYRSSHSSTTATYRFGSTASTASEEGVVSPPRYKTTATHKRCPQCLRNVNKKCYADHRKVHYLRRTNNVKGGTLVDEARACNCCQRNERPCIVAPEPRVEPLRTFRCLMCLDYKEACSFRSDFAYLDPKKAKTHPALT